MISLVKKYKNNVKTFRLKKIKDNRGHSFYIDKTKIFKKKFNFQYYSFNKKIGTFRGFHYQTKFKQNKILYVHKGKILDVLVDIKTKKIQNKIILNSEKNNIIFIPNSLAHGYQTLTKDVELFYYIDAPFKKEYSKVIKITSTSINNKLPLKITRISKNDL